ncbi:DUF5605 domain-containing protein [Agromyces mangrovi Wang et al. 2018]|uniref:DUF5605 domain-containing protein n=1 Tax=Agromyces mangrovi TaxID=1858653 RepID=UPI0025729D34|nr:DUF5605 domain-containing protein [Agromyces mangrovi]
MPTFHARSNIADVVAQADAREAIRGIAPEVLDSPLANGETSFPLARILGVILDGGDPRIAELVAALGGIEDRTPRPPVGEPIVPTSDYEGDDVAPASADVTLPVGAAANRMAELAIAGPSHGNPFVDVDLTAVFTFGERELHVGGFYDGDGRYLIRFLPPVPGAWTFVTASNARSLDGIDGVLEIVPGDAPGAVHADGMHFAHADGTPFVPAGTTSYAWTHQEDERQEQTLAALAQTSFNKLRMGLFPKHFIYNENEPERFVFPREGDGWDTTRFDLDFFRHLEKRIDQLDGLGIQADLIFFHPYDRWGFAELGAAVDDRYVAYVVRRLAAYPNVWWSLANEYDLLLTKDAEDWDRIGTLVRENDPFDHPLSIHNWVDIWDYSSPWATHASIQYGELLGGKVREWRRAWSKPVVVDECGYEGDIDQGWGFLTAEEEVARFWAIAMSGGYATHGETYWAEGDVVFWAKGGELRGASPARIAFLQSLIADSPTGRLEPLPSDFDAVHAGVAGEYVLISFGGGQPAFRTVTVPDGVRARIEVIDAWNMTIEPVAGLHEGAVRVELPGRPHTAIRWIAESASA